MKYSALLDQYSWSKSASNREVSLQHEIKLISPPSSTASNFDGKIIYDDNVGREMCDLCRWADKNTVLVPLSVMVGSVYMSSMMAILTVTVQVHTRFFQYWSPSVLCSSLVLCLPLIYLSSIYLHTNL